MCSCMGSVSVSSCRCCMFVSCVHPVAVHNVAFCMTCSLLMLVEDARCDHMVSVMLYPCIECVALSMDLFVLYVSCLTVFVNCLVKQFAISLDVIVILLLNVMDVFSGGGGALLDRPCMVVQRMCVLGL